MPGSTRFVPFDLICGWCSRHCPFDQIARVCRNCDRPILARYQLNVQLGARLRSQLESERRGLWRYRELLPIQNQTNIFSLGEGGTPLIPVLRLGGVLGVQKLWVKDESQNPTGSFKARGMTVAISRAYELGIRRFCLPSAGNAAGAAAAYAALAGCEVRAYMPDDSGEGFFEECRAYGAEVVPVKGSIADCGARMRKVCDPEVWFDLSTLKEPFRLEGKKTMGYELWEDFGSQGVLPDVIIYPTGGGTGLIGMWKAFDEMEQLGWIGSQRPRMISVQAEGCAPIVRALAAGEKTAEQIVNPQTSALGLRVPSAIGDFLILRAIRESGGTAVSVTEAEWADGQSLLASHAGLFASPEGGAAVAALRKCLAQGSVSASESVVLFNTGSGYKYPRATWPRR